jgi:hypothetical protein
MAFTCTVSQNIGINCADDQANAGLQDVYLVFSEQLDTVTPGAANAHTVTAVTTVSSAKFVRVRGRFEKKSLESAMSRENYGRRSERTLNVFIPNFDVLTAQYLNDYSCGGKVFVIVALNNKTGSDRNAVVFGWDGKIEEEGGALMVVNEQSDEEIGGVIGYNCVFTSIATEPMRRYIGTITVEDGSTGETVTFA